MTVASSSLGRSWRRTMMEALLVAIPLVLIFQWGLGSPPWEAASARPLDSLFEDAAKAADGFDWSNITETEGKQSYPTDLCDALFDLDADMCYTLFCSEKLYADYTTIGTTTGLYATELCMATATVGVCDASCRNVTNDADFGNEGNKLLVYDTATAVREALDAFVYTPEFRDVNLMLEWCVFRLSILLLIYAHLIHKWVLSLRSTRQVKRAEPHMAIPAHREGAYEVE